MAVRKNAKAQSRTINLETPLDSDLSLRLENISKQTGLSHFDLIQKWILQEEFLIGLYGNRRTVEKTKPPRKGVSQKAAGVKEQKNAAQTDSEGMAYRKTLVKRIKKLKKEGMTLNKIATTFNNENVATLSGKGKWYSHSINILLNPKK